MIGRVEETSASFEARSAPRSHPTTLGQERTSTVHLPMSAFPPEADIERSDGLVRLVPILLQKSLMAPAWSDSLVQTRFGVEAGDDGAAQSRPKAAVLFI